MENGAVPALARAIALISTLKLKYVEVSHRCLPVNQALK